MSTLRISMILAGVMACSAVACGGSSKGGEGGDSPTIIDTGIRNDTKANELTDAQTQQLCDATFEAVEELFSGPERHATDCGAYAWTLTLESKDPDECRALYADCLDRPIAKPSLDRDSCLRPSHACTATIGQIEECYSDQYAVLDAYRTNAPGCNDIGKEPADYPFNNDPSSCHVVKEKCPELFEAAAEPEEPIPGDD